MSTHDVDQILRAKRDILTTITQALGSIGSAATTCKHRLEILSHGLSREQIKIVLLGVAESNNRCKKVVLVRRDERWARIAVLMLATA